MALRAEEAVPAEAPVPDDTLKLAQKEVLESEELEEVPVEDDELRPELVDSDNEEEAPPEDPELDHEDEIDGPPVVSPEYEFIERCEREDEAIAAACLQLAPEKCSTSPATSTTRRPSSSPGMTTTALPSPTTVPAAKFPLGDVPPPPKAPSVPRRPGASARAKAPCACCPRRASPTPSLLQAMTDVVNDQAMSCNVIDVVYPEGAELLSSAVETPRYIALKVVLDSGAGAHVVNKKAVPGYAARASAMSSAGAASFAADGGRIKNYGEVQVNMVSLDSQGKQHLITSKFEAADVTRALWSVGVICDSGLDVRFSATRAWVLDEQGQELCVFHRTAGSGLYIAEVMVENPDHPDFQRRGA